MNIHFDLNSWHHRFVSKMTNYSPHDLNDANICAYTRAFVWAVIKALCMAVMGLGFVISFIRFILVPPAPAVVALFCVLFIMVCVSSAIAAATIGAVFYLVPWIRSKMNTGPVFIMYKNWKEKTCAKIDWS